AVAVDPDGRSVWVAERCGSNSCLGSPLAPIMKFDSTGALVASFGAGTLLSPHGIDVDRHGNVWVTDCTCTGASIQAHDSTRGHLFVSDRSNNRILILDRDFNILDTWYQFSRPSGIYIDANDNIYVSDSESGSVAPDHGSWTRGIRIGSARNGRVVAFIPDP